MRVLKTYGLAALSVTLALVLTLAVRPIAQHSKFLLFVLAVFTSATGGVGPGVFAALLSVAMADYFFVQPLHSFMIANLEDMVPLLLFSGVGTVITLTMHRLRRSDEANRAAAAVVESSADSIMQQGLDNTILSWNKAAERIYGYTAKEAIGRPVSLIVPPDRIQEMQGLVERVHLGESFQSYETVRMKKDGTRVDVALTLSPIEDRGRRITGISSIAREITKQKQTEQAIRESNERLERQTRQLKRQTHELTLLAEMADLLQASSSAADLYAIAGRFARTLIPAISGALYVYSAPTKDLELVSRWGDLQPVEQEFLASDDCWGLRRGHAHFVANIETGVLCRHLPDPPPACYLCAPMIAFGESVGLLHLRLSPPRRASSGATPTDSMEFPWAATPIAEQLALAVANPTFAVGAVGGG